MTSLVILSRAAKRIGMTAALLTASLAGQAHAASAMDACVEAFVKGNFPAEQPIKVRKYDRTMNYRESSLRNVEIVLTARETRTGREVATAKCVADSSGVVIALDTQRAERTSVAAAEEKHARNR